MAAMWELPQISRPKRRSDPEFVLRHSITVTDYSVRVWRVPAPEEARGQWVAREKLGRVALTGLARKILRMAELV
jgi:hypothetical protein